MLKFSRQDTHELLPEDVFSGGVSLRYPLELLVRGSRLRVFFYVFVAAFLVMSIAAGWLMLFEHESYVALAERNTARLRVLEARRGTIRDQTGNVLAKDEPYFTAVVPASSLPQNPDERMTALSNISRKLGIELSFVTSTQAEINAATSTLSQSDTVLKDNLTADEVLLFEVRGAADLGVRFEEHFRRNLSDPLAFSHLLGYVGEPTAKDISVKGEEVRVFSRLGKDGLERAYDELLRGSPGFFGTRRDTGELIRKEPLSGATLTLTIDAKLEEYLFNRMKEELAGLGLRRGAALAQDPQSGAILALVSFPALDAQELNKGLPQEKAKALLNNPDFPFLNRVVSGEYPPGSVIKPFVAAAALEEKVIKPEDKILSTGQIKIPNPFRPGEVSIFRDWKAHGWVDLRRALAVSSNAYFYTIGGGYKNRTGLGIERLAKYYRFFGFGKKLGVDLPTEGSGLVPDKEWKREKRPRDPIWRVGDTYNVSIGQGDVTVTPLQISSAISAVANGGKLWRPYVVSAVENVEAKTVTAFSSQLISTLPITQENLEIVREGMRMMVTDGMGALLQALPFAVAGKTGTPQVARGETTHAWFSGFAPYENPQIVLTIILEGEKGGSTKTLPIAKDVFNWYLTRLKTQS